MSERLSWYAEAVWWFVRTFPRRAAIRLVRNLVLALAALSLFTHPFRFSALAMAGLVAMVELSVVYGRAARGHMGAAIRIGTIKTTRLVLRAVRKADATGLAASIDDEVIQSNGWTAQNVVDWRAVAQAPWFMRAVNDWVIVERETSLVCGAISVQPGSDRSKCQLGWWIGPGARRRGYATEAVVAVIDALHQHGYDEIEAGTAESNTAVQRILETAGARQIRSGPHELPNGDIIASRWYLHRP